MKKRIEAILMLIPLLTLILFSNTVFAASMEIRLEKEVDDNIITIAAEIKNNPGIAGYKFELNYDPDIFTPVEDNTFFGDSWSDNGIISHAKKGKVIFGWISDHSENSTAKGDLFSADFKINGNYENSKFTLTYDKSNVVSQDYSEVSVSVNEISFIKMITEETPIPEETPVIEETPVPAETHIPEETLMPEPSTAETIKVNVNNPFSDVQSTDWFYDYLMYSYANKLFNGTSENTFSPQLDMTRAMFVTVLYRMVGNGVQAQTSGFSDVDINSWYGAAVSWAAGQGLVSGTSGNIFSPDDVITREQMMVIIYNYFRGEPVNYNLTFSDSAMISQWAKDAVRYCVSKGIISGRDNNMLEPLEGLTRAEASKMFYIVATTLNNAGN